MDDNGAICETRAHFLEGRRNEQSPGPVSVNSITESLPRGGNAKSVMNKAIGQDKCCNQYAFVTLALPVNFLKILASAQIRRHNLRPMFSSEKASVAGVLLNAAA